MSIATVAQAAFPHVGSAQDVGRGRLNHGGFHELLLISRRYAES